jgi:hypothetical protein
VVGCPGAKWGGTRGYHGLGDDALGRHMALNVAVANAAVVK